MHDDEAAFDAQRRDLQRRVFSAGVDSADSRSAARQLQELEKRQRDEAIDREAREAAARAQQRQADPDPDRVAEPTTDPVTHDSEASGGRARSAFTGVRLVIALVVTLAAGTALGFAFGIRSPTPVTAAGATTRPVVDISGALDLFDRPQTASDLPKQALPGTVIGESIRAIGDPFFELYIGRNAANMVCLFAVQPADSFAMACVTINEFPSTGIRLEWSGEMASMSADGSMGTVASTMRAIWRPDGSLDLGGGPR